MKMEDMKMNNTVYLYVFDTMADWEIGYLTAELNSGRYFKKGLSPSKIVTMGVDRKPVTTMGGMKIIPEITVEDCNITKIDALILPGGDTWMDAAHQSVIKLAEKCINENIIVAAICAATLGLARSGLLDTRWHTSNDLDFLKMLCSDYKGDKYYKYEPAVTDGKLITAPGTAPLEFTLHVLKALEVFSPETLDIWYKMIVTRQPEYYYKLMESIQ
jgi:putative intracellular protease/amidase